METPTPHRRSRLANSNPLPEQLRQELAALVTGLGEPEARRIVGLSRGAFTRALAGLGVYPGTAAMIRVAVQASKPMASVQP